MATYFPDGPDPVAADVAAIREGLAQAYTAVAANQQASHAFITAFGAEVTGGHPDVRRPGAQGDPDPTLDAADQ